VTIPPQVQRAPGAVSEPTPEPTAPHAQIEPGSEAVRAPERQPEAAHRPATRPSPQPEPQAEPASAQAPEAAPRSEPLPAGTSDTQGPPSIPPPELAQIPSDRDIDEGLGWEQCGPVAGAKPLGLAPPPAEGQPIEITADAVDIWPEADIGVFSGDVEVVRGQALVEGEWVRVDRGRRLLDAAGDLYYEQPGLRLTGSAAHFDLDAYQGEITDAEYRLTETNNARGEAALARLEGRKTSSFEDITYTTCRPGSNDWLLEAKDLRLDRSTGVGRVKSAKLRLGTVPVAYVPRLSFPIDDRRKSGFLLPSIGTSDNTGFDVSTPYYFNIAPNYDATFTPRLMAKRGIMLGGEFRYLTQSHSGRLRGQIVPDDRDAGPDEPSLRGAFSGQHRGTLAPRLSTDINVNYASDERYLEDFGNRLEVSSTRQLERRGDLSYRGQDWSLRGRVQYFQTMDESIAEQNRPYIRMPQFLFRLRKPRQPLGLTYNLNSEYVYFNHSSSDKVTGHRFALVPAMSLPLRRSFGHLIPKVRADYRYYDLTNAGPGLADSRSLLLPGFSLDGGLVFERFAGWFGNASLQTLEPRLFYLYTPYKNQTDLPVFDTTEIDFNFGSLFRENRFTGRDRIGDANQLTLALTSRTLSEDTGKELLRASIGQIYYFRDLRVQLPGQPVDTNNSSTLASEVGARLSGNWSTHASLFWNPHDGGFAEKGAALLHYQSPGNRIVNIGYRYNRGEEDVDTDTRISDTDISVRWPFGSKVHFIGRWKYSLFYDKTMDSFAGLEYDSCCWALRALARNYVSDVNRGSNTSFMVQLELKGLAAVGSRIEDFLEEGILGYRAE
jgi:LPS-assembly protein